MFLLGFNSPKADILVPSSDSLNNLARHRLANIYKDKTLGFTNKNYDILIGACDTWAKDPEGSCIAFETRTGDAKCISVAKDIPFAADGRMYMLIDVPVSYVSKPPVVTALYVVAHSLTVEIENVLRNARNDKYLFPVSPLDEQGMQILTGNDTENEAHLMLPNNKVTAAYLYKILGFNEDFYPQFIALTKAWAQNPDAEFYIATEDGRPMITCEKHLPTMEEPADIIVRGNRTYVRIPLNHSYMLADLDGELGNIELLLLCRYMVSVF